MYGHDSEGVPWSTSYQPRYVHLPLDCRSIATASGFGFPRLVAIRCADSLFNDITLR